MLILTRKRHQSIVIGDDIVIEILEVSKGQIRVGIAAPDDVRVLRGELPRIEPDDSRDHEAEVADYESYGPASIESGGDSRSSAFHSGNAGHSGETRRRKRVRPGLDAQESHRALLEDPSSSVASETWYRLRQLRSRLANGRARGATTTREVTSTADDRRSKSIDPRSKATSEVDLHPQRPLQSWLSERRSGSPTSTRVSETDCGYRVSGAGNGRRIPDAYSRVERLNEYRGEWLNRQPVWFDTAQFGPLETKTRDEATAWLEAIHEDAYDDHPIHARLSDDSEVDWMCWNE